MPRNSNILSIPIFSQAILILVLSQILKPTVAHVAAWHKGMYCLNGTTPGKEDQNTNAVAVPLYKLSKKDWWFHHVDGCDELPPDKNDFLELPNQGTFTVELATNRAFTTLSYDGKNAAKYLDGKDHPGLGETNEGKSDDGCIITPNIHTQNESMAAGTAFAISYTSDLSSVTTDNLVVFTTLYHTPWYRLASYSVPDLPACPKGGCICAWGWVPNGCGEPNMYMQGFRCRVTGNTGARAVGRAKPAAWCEDDSSNCVDGPKQIIAWNQLEGNNIEVSGYDLSGSPRSPGYNSQLGFLNGAQNDIFLAPGTAQPTYVAPTPTPTKSGAKQTVSSTRLIVWLILSVTTVVLSSC